MIGVYIIIGSLVCAFVAAGIIFAIKYFRGNNSDKYFQDDDDDNNDGGFDPHIG